EIVLTGVDLTSYGADLPGSPTLGQLARRLLTQLPELPRLRLSSLDPAEIDDALWTLIATEPRLMPHLHLSVQSGDDLILKRMKRRHTRADVLSLCARARALRPDIVFGADLITGFPTETEAMAESTLRLVAEAGITYLHVFPYSERPGTSVARMPQVLVPLRRERAARLREAGRRALEAFLGAQPGRTATILMESAGIGRTEQFAPLRPDRALAPGSLARVAITGASGSELTGRVL